MTVATSSEATSVRGVVAFQAALGVSEAVLAPVPTEVRRPSTLIGIARPRVSGVVRTVRSPVGKRLVVRPEIWGNLPVVGPVIVCKARSRGLTLTDVGAPGPGTRITVILTLATYFMRALCRKALSVFLI